MTTKRVTIFLIALLAALVAAAALTGPESPTSAPRQSGPRVGRPSEASASWYCAEGTASPGGRADEEIVLGNVGTRASHARITVFAGSDVTPVHRESSVAPGAVVHLHVADFAAVAEPGVLVEVSGGATAVEHQIRRGTDVALGPCAREPAPQARFAAGTTAKGAELWLALFNPFPDDAIVDVRAITSDGVRAPGGMQGVVVPRFSRVSVALHDLVPRVDQVATEVTVRRGRAIAEEALTLDGTDGRRGLALSLGADAARRWWFPMGVIGSGRQEQLVLANDSDREVMATVRFSLDATAIEPETVLVPGASTVTVGFTRVPPNIGFSVSVRAPEPIVAEMLDATTAPLPDGVRGIASDLGITVGASRWVVVPARLEAGSSDAVAVVSTDGKSHRIRLVQRRKGQDRVVARATVPATGRTVWDLAALVTDPNVALEVRADGPVAVERESSRPGLTRSHAVPR